MNWIRGLLYPPVYIFQMGKVGSASVLETLKDQIPGHVFHVHNYCKFDLFQRRLFLFRKFFHLPVKVITPIREPVSRNVSAFFQNFERFTGEKIEGKVWTPEDLKNLFIESRSHNYALEWFDQQLFPSLGINVYESRFPISQKWCTYRRRNIKLLVYRSDIQRSAQLDLLSYFTGTKIDSWIISNVSHEKDYADAYLAFSENVKLPSAYLSSMIDSKYFQHFWSEHERQQVVEKWKE